MNNLPGSQPGHRIQLPRWVTGLRAYQKRSRSRALLQLVDTVVPFAALWIATAAIVVSSLPDPFIVFTVVPAAFFMVRTFIIFHDCCHGSFYPGKRMNRLVGYFTGALTFTAFESWRRSHLEHHATTSQLDHRGLGDIWMMTYEEYRASSRGRRLGYRFYRHPLIHFLFGPLFLFLVMNRISSKGATPLERTSVIVTNLLILTAAIGWSAMIGVRSYLLVQIPILWLAGIIGVWLFYVQHQFDPGYWARDDEWNRVDASVLGASYYRLPRVLNWLTGSIGLHHIHHLLPGIPNYRLVAALEATPEVQLENPLTIRASLASIRLSLWHETEHRFMSFREAKRLLRAS